MKKVISWIIIILFAVLATVEITYYMHGVKKGYTDKKEATKVALPVIKRIDKRLLQKANISEKELFEIINDEEINEDEINSDDNLKENVTIQFITEVGVNAKGDKTNLEVTLKNQNLKEQLEKYLKEKGYNHIETKKDLAENYNKDIDQYVFEKKYNTPKLEAEIIKECEEIFKEKITLFIQSIEYGSEGKAQNI